MAPLSHILQQTLLLYRIFQHKALLSHTFQQTELLSRTFQQIELAHAFGSPVNLLPWFQNHILKCSTVVEVYISSRYFHFIVSFTTAVIATKKNECVLVNIWQTRLESEVMFVKKRNQELVRRQTEAAYGAFRETAVDRLYHRVLYFQSVTRCHGACVNVISFTPIRKV